MEINALWYSGLRSLADAVGNNDATAAANLRDLAENAGRSFRREFWNEQARCLFDCLTPDEGGKWRPDASIRPNQIFAVSLPHSPLSPEQQQAVVSCVKTRLLTPMGVRTLDPADSRYRGRYEGSLFERDAAYHQGTAWPWLLGAYAEAVMRVGDGSAAARTEARDALEPIIAAMDPFAGGRAASCVGQIAEVYDGDVPQRPGGCPAQAWSASEALRAYLLTLDQD